MKKATEKKKAKYAKPKIKYEKKLEAFAAVCGGNSGFKAQFGMPDGLGGTCLPPFYT
ncbi:MAG: hypothetical protein H8D56_16210 [Planctomycetes bacterium]|nr:hypothetical protein [Planctomycetota bacterium]